MNKTKSKLLSKIVLTAAFPLAVLAGVFALPSAANSKVDKFTLFDILVV